MSAIQSRHIDHGPRRPDRWRDVDFWALEYCTSTLDVAAQNILKVWEARTSDVGVNIDKAETHPARPYQNV